MRMPRFLSAVTILSSSLPIVLTHTCRTFFLSGAIQAMRVPSGEMCGLARSGLPKRTSRGMSGPRSAHAAVAKQRTIGAIALKIFMRTPFCRQSYARRFDKLRFGPHAEPTLHQRRLRRRAERRDLRHDQV